MAPAAPLDTIKLADLNELAAEIKSIAANRGAISDSPTEMHTVTFNTTPTGLTVTLPAPVIKTLLDAVSSAKTAALAQHGVTID